jgi:hypothetical protein
MQSHLRRRSSQAVTNRGDAPQERLAVAGSAMISPGAATPIVDTKLLIFLMITTAVLMLQSNSTSPVLSASLGLMITYCCDILGLCKSTLAAMFATIVLSGYITLHVMWLQLPGGLLCLLCTLGVIMMAVQLELCSLLQFK